MNWKTLRSRTVVTLAALLAASSLAFAQGVATPKPATPVDSATVVKPATPADSAAAAKPAPPTSPVSSIRNKISAGDLLSAESILEVYREKNGADAAYCSGLAWLARGALLLGDLDKAKRYSADARALCADRIAKGDTLEKEPYLETALGAAIEVDAQLVERDQGARAAAKQVRAELAQLEGPVALRSRVHKRLNMLSLTGTQAPELEVEDWIGDKPPSLASLAGKPVLLFIWSESCGDCRAQAASLARIKSRHAAEGLQVIALSRYYDEAEKRGAEKARADSAWKASYAGVGTIPMVMSTASMERYGGSSTPTFVFVDRKGVVRGYTPTRLTDAEFDRALAPILR